MKTLKIITIVAFTSLISVMFADEEQFTFTLQSDVKTEIQRDIEQSIKSDMNEVKMWIDLYQEAEKQYIDIESYPSEIESYMLEQSKIIEKYLTLVDDAEILFYENKDYKSKIKEATEVLSNLKVMRKIFDEYVEYKSAEKSPSFLKLTEDAIRNQKAIPRMNIQAYTVLRGEYPTKITQDGRTRLTIVRRNTLHYSNGDTATFLNDKLISTAESND